MRPISKGPWTITVATPEGDTFRVHHRKNYIPEDHSMRDLIQLSRLIRRAEKWARHEEMQKPPYVAPRYEDGAFELLREIVGLHGKRVCGVRLGGDPDDKRCGKCLGCRCAALVEDAKP